MLAICMSSLEKCLLDLSFFEYSSAIKKNEIMQFAAIWGPTDYHTKWSKPDKDKYHMILLICGL